MVLVDDGDAVAGSFHQHAAALCFVRQRPFNLLPLGDVLNHRQSVEAVSYTHLDVYKRQEWAWPPIRAGFGSHG